MVGTGRLSLSNSITNGDEDLNSISTRFAPLVAQTLPHSPCFDLDSDLTGSGLVCEKHIHLFENLHVAIDVQDDAIKKASLLRYAGEKFKTYSTLFRIMKKHIY